MNKYACPQVFTGIANCLLKQTVDNMKIHSMLLIAQLKNVCVYVIVMHIYTFDITCMQCSGHVYRLHEAFLCFIRIHDYLTKQ